MNTNMVGDWSLHPEKSTDDNPFYDVMGIRLLALLRVTLAISGLLLAQNFRSSMSSRAMTAASLVLTLYLIYSMFIYGLVFFRKHLLYSRSWHWVDLVWWLTVIAATGGGQSAFYLFFIYPIIVASFRWGTNEGVTISIGTVASWLLVALAELDESAWSGQWQGVLLKAVTLLVLGYAIALWAGFEALQKKRLALLSELNRLPNPRFGPDRLISITLERLCRFYHADNCIAAFAADAAPSIYMARTAPSENPLAEMPADALRIKLLSLPEHCAVAYNTPARWGRLIGGIHILTDKGKDPEQRALIRSCSHVLAHDFNTGPQASSWVSVPLELRGAVLGRMFLLSRHSHFGIFDIYMLKQAMDTFMPLMETVKLLDGLASEAAEKERRRISLDLHDGVIQPYLGLKLGLESLLRNSDPRNALAADLQDLCRMTTDSIAELRRYVSVLNARTQECTAPWLEGLHRQVNKFRRFYGFDIEVNIHSSITLNDRLATEVLQMISESLSNVGRHTAARQVTINLSSYEEHFIAQIINNGADEGTAWKTFTPVSLTRRAQYLGGSVDVMRHSSGGTEVLVRIPL